MTRTATFITRSLGILILAITIPRAQGGVGFQQGLFDCGSDLGAKSQHHLSNEIKNLQVSIRSHAPFPESKNSYERIFCFALGEIREIAHDFGFLAPHCGFAHGRCETLDVIFDCEKLCRATHPSHAAHSGNNASNPLLPDASGSSTSAATSPAEETTNLPPADNSRTVTVEGNENQDSGPMSLETTRSTQEENDVSTFNSEPASTEDATFTADTVVPDLAGTNDSAPDVAMPETASFWVSSNSPVAYDQVVSNPEPASIVVWLVLGMTVMVVRSFSRRPIGQFQQP